MALAPRRSAPSPVLALICLILALLLGTAFLSYSPQQDPHFYSDADHTRNLVGLIGVQISSFAFRYIGISAWSLPIFLIIAAGAFLFHRRHVFTIGRAVAFLVFFSSACAFSALLGLHLFGNEGVAYGPNPYSNGLGGGLGKLIYSQHIQDLLGVFGSATVFIGALIISGLFLFIYRFPHTFERGLNQFLENRKRRKEQLQQRAKERQEARELALAGLPQPAPLPDRSKKKIPPQPVQVDVPVEERSDKTGQSAPPPFPPLPEPRKKRGWFRSASAKAAAGSDPAEDLAFGTPSAAASAEAGEVSPESALQQLGQRLGKNGPLEQAAPISYMPRLPIDSSATEKPAPRMPRTSPIEKPAIAKAAGRAPDTIESKAFGSSPAVASAEAGPKIIQSERVEKARQHLPKKKGDYIFPNLDLLSNPPAPDESKNEDYEETGRALVTTLETFGVKVSLKDIHVGPVITRYDVLPAPGTRVSNIQNLENDIAMGMKALAVRILAPVPGTGFVGIEVPNRNPQPVCLREILESKVWAESKAEIPIGLGKDVSGNPLVADLTKMPHLLIAGSTGAGKTVCINSIIASLLYHASPDDLKFIMIDPKVVEMQVYNSLPHMLIPVVTEPKKVPQALKWLINEMTRRYNMFAKVRVRNIAGFNAHQKKMRDNPEPLQPSKPNAQGEFDIPRELEDELEMPEKLPYIVCVIDELADLMMVAPADVESGIARLAQLARAAGIHLILATQRPSVKVITGTIKANLPSRISFKVAALVDSRTILDAKGAEQLIGKGDMLFLPPGQARLVRSQGAFVSDDEINGIVDFLAASNGEPQYEESVQREIDKGDDPDGFDSEESDELLKPAIEVLRTTKRASTSMLQRRLKIGYNRAARIMETLEDRGIVGPENGASPREILVDLDSL